MTAESRDSTALLDPILRILTVIRGWELVGRRRGRVKGGTGPAARRSERGCSTGSRAGNQELAHDQAVFAGPGPVAGVAEPANVDLILVVGRVPSAN